jgi:hypothetical protein
MATCRDITNLALRKLGKLGAGREARIADATDALDALQSMYVGWVASGAFGRLHDVQPSGPEYTARCGQRVTRTSAALVEVILPEQTVQNGLYDYGRCIPGYVYPQDGDAVVIVTLDTGLIQTWLYDGTAKKWQDVTMLQMDDVAPRSVADRQGLASCLAIELADQYGAALHPTTLAQAGRYKTALVAHYGFDRQPVADRGSYV